VRFVWWILSPLVALYRLVMWPARRVAKRNVLKKSGWAELLIQGTVHTFRPKERFPLPPIVKKFLRRPDQPRVVLSRLHRFVDELTMDPHAKGVLVKIGSLGGGWVDAVAIRKEIDRLRDAGKSVLIHVGAEAGNREFLIASGGTRVLMTPQGPLAAVGTAGSTLFMKDALHKAGVKFEVAARGRYKSAPDQFTRSSRSDTDLEQTKALVDAVDAELVRSIAEGRGMPEDEVKAMMDRAPMIGSEAKKLHLCDDVAHDEDLLEEVRTIEGIEKPPKLVGAGWYLNVRDMQPPFRRKRKQIGVVEVHGAIVDRGSPYVSYFDKLAIEAAVVNDLRAALEDRRIGAVVLHVDSRGGSVTASDAIYSAVKRLDQEKPVIACFNNVAASGGYYVACGARSIVCSPLTITGSIGVFAMYPVWPELARSLGLNHDVVKNRLHASMYDPWREISDEARAHADKEVGAMYESFVELVAEARNKSKDETDAVAQGRVWSGKHAHEIGLVDGLGGMDEAIARAKEAAGPGVRFEADPVIVRSWRTHTRPPPFDPSVHKNRAGLDGLTLLELVRRAPGAEIAAEILTLTLTTRSVILPVFAYAPITLT
jgi:protease-4